MTSFDYKQRNSANIISSKFPICPKCYGSVIFDINNYIIKLSDCENRHSINVRINDYEKTQRTQFNEEKNFRCEIHNELYNSYCNSCKINICFHCQRTHLNHDIKSFGNIFLDKNRLINKLREFENIINKFKADLNDIINKINKVKLNVEILYNIYYNMINNFDNNKKNYEVFESLNRMQNINFIKDLQIINQTNNINTKIQYVLEIYKKMYEINPSNLYNLGDNITTNSNSNLKYNPEILKHMIRFPLFKRELKSNNYMKNNYIQVCLIKNEIMTKFKDFFQLKKLFDVLENEKLLIGITYQNSDMRFLNIYNYLCQKKEPYIEHIKKLENSQELSFNANESIFNFKYINNNSNLKYIDDFEIIDQGFGNFINQSMKKNINILPAQCCKIEDKILLAIYINQSYIYEILNINTEGVKINIEYLIEIKGGNSLINSNDINSMIFQTFMKNGFKKLISLKNPINLGNNISINIYGINKLLNSNSSSSGNYNKSTYENTQNNNQGYIPTSSSFYDGKTVKSEYIDPSQFYLNDPNSLNIIKPNNMSLTNRGYNFDNNDPYLSEDIYKKK